MNHSTSWEVRESVTATLVSFFNVTKYLYENQIAGFMCQNWRLALFGMASTQWNVADATTFVLGLANLWDNWA